jgi:hypothetical protein
MRKKLYIFKHFAVHVDKNTNTDTNINNLILLQSYSVVHSDILNIHIHINSVH